MYGIVGPILYMSVCHLGLLTFGYKSVSSSSSSSSNNNNNTHKTTDTARISDNTAFSAFSALIYDSSGLTCGCRKLRWNPD